MQRWELNQNPQRCLTCESHVTPEFRRGYGDERDRAHRCPKCDTVNRLADGSAAGQPVEIVDPLEQPSRFGETFDELPPQVQALCHEVTTDGGEDDDLARSGPMAVAISPQTVLNVSYREVGEGMSSTPSSLRLIESVQSLQR